MDLLVAGIALEFGDERNGTVTSLKELFGHIFYLPEGCMEGNMNLGSKRIECQEAILRHLAIWKLVAKRYEETGGRRTRGPSAKSSSLKVSKYAFSFPLQ
jgi:hypothetical protein